MKVKTDYVPEDKLYYLTPGKVYDVVKCSKYPSNTCIISDDGGEDAIAIGGCRHLKGRPWDIVEE